MQGFPRVLLQMDVVDPHFADGAVVHFDDDLAPPDYRAVQLRDLVALRQIGVEVVLPVERGLAVDFGFQSESRLDGLLKAELVHDRKHSRHCGIDEVHIRVRRRAEFRRRAREQLGVGGHLRVHFQADDDFPIAGSAAH